MTRNGSGALHVVLYHHVGDASSELIDRLGVTTSPGVFERHLEYFVRRFDIVDLEQVISGDLPRRALLITFDDGYRSVLDVAQPLLARQGSPFVFFVSGAFVRPRSLAADNLLCYLSHHVEPAELERAVTGADPVGLELGGLIGAVADLPYERQTRLVDELAERFEVDVKRLRTESGLFLDKEDLPRLPQLGIEVGNHTRSHLHCRAIRDDAAANEQLVDYRRQLEEWTGAAVRAFSYPYGYRQDATALVRRHLEASGHVTSFLAEARPNPGIPADALWQRVCVDGRPARTLRLALGALPRLRTVRDRVRSAVGDR